MLDLVSVSGDLIVYLWMFFEDKLMENGNREEYVDGCGVEDDFIDSELEELNVYVFLDIFFWDFLRCFVRSYLEL